ncbi:hypothetical protein ACH0BF_16600 [Pseudobacillus sp. 179-B 2D1 NHS]|uniref:hypothetical protein n=1 Tax=Pseudobacillus sp. 179-B 2D1 NHS TaxID=3374292 RepID=UPI0038798A59
MFSVIALLVGLFVLGIFQFIFITAIIARSMKKKENPQTLEEKQEALADKMLQSYEKRRREQVLNDSANCDGFITDYLKQHKEEFELYEKEKTKLLEEKIRSEQALLKQQRVEVERQAKGEERVISQPVPGEPEEYSPAVEPDLYISESQAFRDIDAMHYEDIPTFSPSYEPEGDMIPREEPYVYEEYKSPPIDHQEPDREPPKYSHFPESTFLQEMKQKFSVSEEVVAANEHAPLLEEPYYNPPFEDQYIPVNPEIYNSVIAEPNIVFTKEEDFPFERNEHEEPQQSVISAVEQNQIITFMNRIDIETQRYVKMKKQKWVAMTEKERKQYLLLEKITHLSKLPQTQENMDETILTLYDLYRHEGKKSDMELIRKQYPGLFKKKN